MSSAETIFQKSDAKRPTFDELSHLRFFVILLIVCNHLGLGENNLNSDEKYGFKIWFEFTSPFLAVISGWLFFFNLKGEQLLSKIQNRISTLLVPYVVWTVLHIIVHSLFKQTYLWLGKPPIWNSPVPSLTWDYLVDAFILHPIVPNFWYLQNLILIVPFNWFILKAIEKPFAFELFYGVVLLLIYNGVPILFSDRFIQYYMAGCYLGARKVVLRCAFIKSRYILFGAIVLLLSLEVKFRSFDHSKVINVPVVLLLLLTLLEILKRNPGSKLHKLSEKYQPHSFFIFASHAVILSMTAKGALLFLPQALLIRTPCYFGFIMFQFIATVISCVLFSKLILFKSNRLWLVMVGQRDAWLAK